MGLLAIRGALISGQGINVPGRGSKYNNGLHFRLSKLKLHIFGEYKTKACVRLSPYPLMATTRDNRNYWGLAITSGWGPNSRHVLITNTGAIKFRLCGHRRQMPAWQSMPSAFSRHLKTRSCKGKPINQRARNTPRHRNVNPCLTELQEFVHWH